MSHHRVVSGWVGWVAIALLLTSCTGWRARSVTELDDRHGRFLVVTADRAYELEAASIEGTLLSGDVVRAWYVSPETRDISAVEDLEPDAIARALGWTPATHADTIVLNTSTFVSVRQWEDHSRAVGVGIGIPVGLGLIGLLVLVSLISSVSCGRPLRVRGRRCITPLSSSGEWLQEVELAAVPPPVRSVLAAIWTQEAQAEHAAVAAFSKLSLELLALGAPPDLVLRAHRAALQEIQHARLCFGIASAYTGRQLGPGPLPQALEGDTVDIQRIAREALVDGCLREGLAAEIAAIGADTAADPEIARVMRIQAREEAQHAALGWSIVEWCLTRGGADMQRALLAAVAQARLPRCDDLPEHGRVPRQIVSGLLDALMARTRHRLQHEALEARATFTHIAA